MDGGDEDEHDEGAHQVGLEHLVPHLGVLGGRRAERERERRKEEGGGGEGKMERQVFRLTKETGHVELAPQTRRRHRHRCMQMFSTTSVRERRELAG